jgi:hypothetical protein
MPFVPLVDGFVTCHDTNFTAGSIRKIPFWDQNILRSRHIVILHFHKRISQQELDTFKDLSIQNLQSIEIVLLLPQKFAERLCWKCWPQKVKTYLDGSIQCHDSDIYIQKKLSGMFIRGPFEKFVDWWQCVAAM